MTRSIKIEELLAKLQSLAAASNIPIYFSDGTKRVLQDLFNEAMVWESRCTMEWIEHNNRLHVKVPRRWIEGLLEHVKDFETATDLESGTLETVAKFIKAKKLSGYAGSADMFIK